MHRSRSIRAAALLGAAALALAGCADSDRDDASGSGDEGERGSAAGGTFVFAASSDPVSLDPAFASDGETFRVARQMFEGLVGTKPGTADPAPLLATEWEASDDGLSYTFTLRDDVTFHDGEPFNAEAVCTNFDRWYNWTGLLQSENISYYYGSLFKGFADKPDDGASTSRCAADDDTSATITLTKPFAGFVQAHVAAGLLDAEPRGDGAVRRRQRRAAPRTTSASASTPRRTRPAPARSQFEAWERGQQVTLEPQRGLLGRQGQGRRGRHPDHLRRPTPVARRCRPARSTATTSSPPATSRACEADGFQIEHRAAVQHPLPRHEPGRAGAQGHQGPPGDRPRDRQGRRHQPVAARGHRAGDAVHPGDRRRLRRRRDRVRVRPGEGQGAARRGRRRAT